MNRTRTGVLVAAVLTAGAGTAFALGPVSAGAASAPSSFSARIYQGSDTSLDLGKSGFSAGDQDLFTGSIVRAGKHVGHVVGSCTTVRAGSTSVAQLCHWSLRLPGSQIVAEGSVVAGPQGPGTFALPIVGGTGAYSGASGQLVVAASDGPIPVKIELR